MAYHQLKNPDILKDELIDVFNLNQQVMSGLLEKVSSINPDEVHGKLYLNSHDKVSISNEITKLIQEDLRSTRDDYNFDDFEIQYFFTLIHPVTKISCFSCELKNPDGGAIIFDIVRIGKYKDEFHLFVPEENQT